MRIDATIGVAYYPFMASMPQWELPHTKVEQAQRTVGLLHKDFHVCVKNQEVIFRAIPFRCFDIPLHANSQKQLDYGGYINRAQYLRGTADELQQLRLTNEGNGWSRNKQTAW